MSQHSITYETVEPELEPDDDNFGDEDAGPTSEEELDAEKEEKDGEV